MLTRRTQSILTSRHNPKTQLTLRTPASQNLPVMKKTAQRRPKIVLPSPGELRLLQILWRIRRGTIEDIVKSSGETTPPNYKTGQTLLRIMERKGHVDHSQDGRAFVFRPLIGPRDLRRLSIREVVTKYFTGSRAELVVELLRDERISRQELRGLENLIRSRRNGFQ